MSNLDLVTKEETSGIQKHAKKNPQVFPISRGRKSSKQEVKTPIPFLLT